MTEDEVDKYFGPLPTPISPASGECVTSDTELAPVYASVATGKTPS